ncbi:hypothetical protein D9615_007064 [Tricholomella constricta]|uniref:SSCRP protein n=1 Tax=Tricholomella constricta TaxID=117010 RepID=A0A8H5H832_9AGAR|nr:hypothetical protein D9615_007064 [Tricholomella constricta]
MKVASAFASFALMITCRAATITLSVVEAPAPTPSFPRPPVFQSLSPLGTGADGATTYLYEAVASVVYAGAVLTHDTMHTPPTPTYSFLTTFTTDPVTVRATVVEDASRFVYHKDPNPTLTQDFAGDHLSCDFDGKGGGACVHEYWLKDRSSTATTTFTGAVVPFYTLVVDDGKAETTKNGAESGAVPASSALLGAMAAGLMFGLFRVI